MSTILVIDDEKGILRSFKLALENTSYKIITVDNGAEAIRLFKQNTIDLVFLDLNMPEMDGVEVLYHIRHLDTKVPVYIITAFHSEFMERLEELRKEEIDFELLKKPIDSSTIEVLSRGILENGLEEERDYV